MILTDCQSVVFDDNSLMDCDMSLCLWGGIGKASTSTAVAVSEGL